MRLYEFQCKHCGHEFEDLVRSDQEVVTCPKCKSTEVIRLLSAVRSQGGRRDGFAPSSSCAAPGGFS
jgi:putative FmdB family regulatory protein